MPQGWGGGPIGRVLVPPPICTHASLTSGGVLREEELDGSAFLVFPSLPICFEAGSDLSVEFLESPLGPLLALSYPGVN